MIKCWFYNLGIIVLVWEVLCEYDKGDIYEICICYNYIECSVRYFKLVLNEFFLMVVFEVCYLIIVIELIWFDNCIEDLVRWKFNNWKLCYFDLEMCKRRNIFEIIKKNNFKEKYFNVNF